jgi:phage recombination protein Bet
LEGRVANGSEIAKVDLCAEFGLTASRISTLRTKICHELDDDDFVLFLTVSKKHDADPFLREIYAIMRWNKHLGRKVMVIQCGIDYYRKRAADSGAYAGNDEPIFEEFPADHQSHRKHPVKASVTVYRIVSGMRVAFSASARWAEYAQYGKDGGLADFWHRMPYSQLAKCAETLALRKAFPRETAGLRTSEEMDQADNPPLTPSRIVEPSPALDLPPTDSRARIIEAERAAEVAPDPNAPPPDWLRPLAFKGNGHVTDEQGRVIADLCGKTGISGGDLKRFLEAASGGKTFGSVADVTRPGYAKLHGLLTAVTEGGKYFFPADLQGRYDPQGVPSFHDMTPASTEEAKKSAAATAAIPF